MSTVQKQAKGFTIIEVVLVLAIAGLIMLMVFIALPALQRGQRDTARKNDAGIVASALNTYRSNKRGAMPTTTNFEADFLKKYVDGLSQYGNNANDVVPKAASTDVGSDTTEMKNDKMIVVLGSTCDKKTSTRAAAIYIQPEGSPEPVCTDG